MRAPGLHFFHFTTASAKRGNPDQEVQDAKDI
jgi:hypothetical protein